MILCAVCQCPVELNGEFFPTAQPREFRGEEYWVCDRACSDFNDYSLAKYGLPAKEAREELKAEGYD